MTTEKELNALIVRNIRELELAKAHIGKVIEPILFKETLRIFSIFSKDNEFDHSDEVDSLDEIWTALPEWIIENNENEQYDLYIGFNCQKDSDESWLSCFSNALSNPITILLYSDSNKPKSWKKFINDAEFEEIRLEIQKHGFLIDNTPWNENIYIVPRIDPEALAKGFEDEDISKALAPIREALDRCLEARPALNKLCAAIRELNAG